MHHSEFPACLLHALVVDEASVGAGAGDDEPGPEEPRRLLQLLVVNEARLGLEEEKRGREGQRSAVVGRTLKKKKKTTRLTSSL